MINLNLRKKGTILLMVLGTILVVVVLANVVLRIILNQSRLTHHQVSRIQAYYAAQAGLVYALEKLRTGEYVLGTKCKTPTGCPYHNLFDGYHDYQPFTITEAKVFIKPTNNVSDTDCFKSLTSSDACVSASVTYTYNP